MTDPIISQPTPAENALTPESPPPAPAEAPAAPAIPDGYYPREAYEKLQKENQAYRERYQPFERTFADFDDDDRQAWLTIAQMAKDEDPNVRKELAERLGFQLPPDETPKYLTEQDFERKWEERQAQIDQRRAIDNVYAQAEAMGYDRDSEDATLLLRAMNYMDEPNIKEADKAVKAYKQRLVDEFLAEKQAQAQVPQVPTTTGQPPRDYVPPKTPSEARKAAEARFAAANRGM